MSEINKIVSHLIEVEDKPQEVKDMAYITVEILIGSANMAEIREKVRKTIAYNVKNDHYQSLKKNHPETILLFRAGGFYESYLEDAKVVADVCGLTLTKQDGMLLAAFPYQALDVYLPKLIRAGHKIAIGDMPDR